MRVLNFPKLECIVGNFILSSMFLNDPEDAASDIVSNFNKLKIVNGDMTIPKGIHLFPELTFVGKELSNSETKNEIINFPKLEYCGGFIVSSCLCNSIALNSFKKCNYFLIENNINLSDISINNLVKITNEEIGYHSRGIFIYNNQNLTSLNFPKLEVINGGIYNNNSLDGNIIYNNSLVNFSFSNIRSLYDGIYLKNEKLNQTSIDHILIKLASLNGENSTELFTGVIDLSGGLNSPPSSAGLDAKTILENRGAIVMVNGV